MSDDSDVRVETVDQDLPVDPDVPPCDRPAGRDRVPEAAGQGLAAVPPAVPVPRRPVRPRGRARVRYLSGRVRRVLRSRGDILAVIAVGGAVGSLGRWGLALLLPHPAGTFPWATFAANVAGCLLLGVLMVFVIEVWPPSRYLRPFLGVGVLGGFTTFSTYMLDARALLVSGRPGVAGGYVFGSLAAGLTAVWVGIGAARLLVRLAERRILTRGDRGRLPGRGGRTIRAAGAAGAGSVASASRRSVPRRSVRGDS